MSACPKCGDTEGFTFRMTETHVMHSEWHGHAEAGDSGLDVKRTLPECVGCGHRFQWNTVHRIAEDQP